MNTPIDLSKLNKIKLTVIDVVTNPSPEAELARNLVRGPILMGACFAMSKAHPNSRFWTPKVPWKALWILEAGATALAVVGYGMVKQEERLDREMRRSPYRTF